MSRSQKKSKILMELFWENFGQNREKITNISTSELFGLHRIAFEPKSKTTTIHKKHRMLLPSSNPNEGWHGKKGGKIKGKDKMQMTSDSLQSSQSLILLYPASCQRAKRRNTSR
jgi:hypothetical protein